MTETADLAEAFVMTEDIMLAEAYMQTVAEVLTVV
jgi:hypothetical protein